MASVSDPTLGTGASIGRYFSIVSVVPSVMLAAWIYVLLAAGAARGNVSWHTLIANNPVEKPAFTVAALGSAMAVAVIGHPLQFALVQLMEGYWPNTPTWRRLRSFLVMGHLQKLHKAYRRNRIAKERRGRLELPDSGDLNQYLAPKRLTEHIASAQVVVETQIDLDSWQATDAAYPTNRLDLMPTMLGNTLRKHELVAGAAIGLPILSWASHIGMAADSGHTTYVVDQRTQMDFAVRVSVSAYIAAALTFLMLWPTGWLVLLTLIPYGAGVASYRGAVVAAEGYGAALQAWVDLNRIRLYQQLGVVMPVDTRTERDQNMALQDLLLGNTGLDVQLAVQSASAVASNASASTGSRLVRGRQRRSSRTR